MSIYLFINLVCIYFDYIIEAGMQRSYMMGSHFIHIYIYIKGRGDENKSRNEIYSFLLKTRYRCSMNRKNDIFESA